MLVKKVLLFGGTGAIGTYLASILDKHSVEVYITTRQKHKDSGHIHYLLGNAKEKEVLDNICECHWDAIVDFFSYKTEEFKGRLYEILNATDQYVFLSSARVFANKEHPIKEDSPRLLDVSEDNEYLKTDEYALTKARQEDLLSSSKRNNWTIVRPYITYGDKRLQLGVMEKEEWLYRALHGRTIIFNREIAERITSLANGYDVSIGIYNLLGRREVCGNSFNITTPERLTWNQIFEIYSSIIKKKANINIKIKNVSVDDFISCRGDGLRYQVIYDRLYNRDFDNTKESQFVSLDDFIKVKDGLSRCLSNFIDMGAPFKSIGWKQEAIKDKLAQETTPLKEISSIKDKLIYLWTRYL